jgi:PAS domain S-box-containing protein
MIEPGDEKEPVDQLRKRAEAALRGQPVDLQGLDSQDIQYLLHELQVHQVELSIQNEELRKTQQELESSRDQYFDLYNFAPAGYCTIDRKDYILEANQVLANMLGVPPSRLIQSRLSGYISPEHQDTFHLHRQHAFQSGSRQVDEIRMRHPDRENLYTRLESVLDHNDPTRLRVMISDITDLKQTEQALKASEERLELILARQQAEEALRASEEQLQLATAAANIGIWDYELPGGEFRSNERYKILLGLPPESDLSIESILDAVHPDDRDGKRECMKEMQATQQLHECEYQVIWPDGSQHWILDVGRSYTDTAGKPVRMAGIAMDITRQKQHEFLIKENAAELTKLNRELRDFAFIASHDLQEPLRKIRAFADRLKDRQESNQNLSADERVFIERMHNAAERMQTMIDNLLAYSRINTRAYPFSEVDLKLVAREALSDLEVLLHQSGGQVQVGELATIDADNTQMRQLFQNLISNALKFTKPGVRPQVQIHGKAVVDDGKSEWFEIYFVDNGIGFSLEHADQLFKPFSRLVGRSEYEGTGIGLAICRKIVERHGGRITARSEPGQGSSFIVTLPVKQS